MPLSTLAASPRSADGVGNSLFNATGDLIFPTGDGARGDLSAYAEGVGRLQVDMVATEVTGGSGDVDVNVALQDLGTVFEGAECHVKTAVGYTPGAHSPAHCSATLAQVRKMPPDKQGLAYTYRCLDLQQ